uniref:Peroxisomal multifunctional enzyme type 2 n=1 Tax=Aceria tosichella TaxID=561515 RepID=A0A6G1S449_9ACAR
MSLRHLARFKTIGHGQQQEVIMGQKRFMSNGNNRMRFDNQTAIITGAGRGLGREYALLLASRGANVVVNDFGGDRSGNVTATGQNATSPAQQVVDEIQNRWPGSKALANMESVKSESGAQALVRVTMEKFGRIDILINNAGILRDRSFAKMSIDDWDQVQNVHLRGSFLVSHECWPHMRKQKYGRIIMTSSTSGLYGNFGQANYSAAKMGLIGLSNTLAIEGASSGIQCNAIVPMAASRMTEDILGEEIASKLNPAFVAPMVAWLCHKDCTETGAVIEAAGGWYGSYKLQRTSGVYLPKICDSSNDSSIESIAENWDKVGRLDENTARVDSFQDHLSELLQTFEKNK